VFDWLNQPHNTDWLLIFDNVDREYQKPHNDLDAYDITRYFPRANHGSVLITTRLSTLTQLGVGLKLDKVNKDKAEAIFQARYKTSYGKAQI
jgi:hypothetical protein